MAVIGTTWVVVMRCQSCEKLFTVKGIPATSLVQTPNETACHHCGHVPGSMALNLARAGRSHAIVELTREKSRREQ
ncbi:MAG TPA: hypothetical protein VGH50_21130 [Candidatus Binatia bacterium]|jgi:DNA-directed RNA polymerase subunit RPC12/RpoP